MFAADQYQLLDFGAGRKLERFGGFLVDRPAPAADNAGKSDAAAWRLADARYERRTDQTGTWSPPRTLPAAWTIQHPQCTLELRPTPFGHLGLFAEQAENWNWIAERVAGATRPLRVVNLFAYTGGSTLSAARAGAQVVHVDAAKNTVSWARRNARHSNLADAPIRWIVEDARKFVEREVRRGNRYEAVILDPPSYGHGPKNEVWRIEQDLIPLLQLCRQVTAADPAFFLLTCHSPGFPPARLKRIVAEQYFGSQPRSLSVRPLRLVARDGRSLPCGVVARF